MSKQAMAKCPRCGKLVALRFSLHTCCVSRKPKYKKIKRTDDGVRCTCGHNEPLAAYAIAQMAMNVAIEFVCPKCGARHPLN